MRDKLDTENSHVMRELNVLRDKKRYFEGVIHNTTEYSIENSKEFMQDLVMLEKRMDRELE